MKILAWLSSLLLLTGGCDARPVVRTSERLEMRG